MDQLARLQAALGQRYALDREVGRGMTTTVYAARDLKHDRLVAIKVLDPETTAGLAASRFLREIRIVARLQHPHILPLFDSGQADGFLYFVMPFVEGESLRDRLARTVQIPLADALRITEEVGEALAHAHDNGVIHRDIKPENILLMGGHAVVADFGIARALNAAAPDGVTTAGLAVGTPAYMSPEQCLASAHVDGRSDIYSLGCVLYEMLTGEPPFPGLNRRAVMARHVQEPPPSPRTLRPAAPVEVESIVAKALAKLPADRYQTPDELRQAVAALSGGARPDAAPPRSRWTPVAAVVVAVLLVLWAGRAILNRSSSPTGMGGALVVLPFEVSGEGGDEVPLHRVMENALASLPELGVIDGADLLDAAVGGWRAHDLTELLRDATSKGGEFLLVGGLLEVGGVRTLAVDGYATRSRDRLFHLEERPLPSRVEDAVDRLALSVARELAAAGVETGVPAYLFRSTPSARALGYLLLGQERFYREDLDGAKAAFDEAIRSDSTFALAYHRRSLVAVWRWDYPSALADADLGIGRAASATPEWQELLRAQRLLVTRQADSLVDLMERYVSDFPDNADGWFLLGEADEVFSSVTGGCATDAIGRWQRSLEISGDLAPVHRDIVRLALQGGNEELARAHLEAYAQTDTFARAAVDLQFGDDSAREATLRELQGADRPLLSRLVMHFGANALDLPLADTLASILLEPQRSSADRQRGAYYHLAVGAARGRLDEALATWNRLRSGDAFDLVIADAYLAGYPVGGYALPVFADALAQVRGGGAPDYAADQPWDESRSSFRALVHRAVMEGDSAEIRLLLDHLDRASPAADASDPMPGNLRAALLARLALLAADTSAAVAWLVRSTTHPVTHLNVYPLMSMAPERLRLAELLAGRGEYVEAARWTGTFASAGALTDVLYEGRVAEIDAALTSAGVTLQTCGRAATRR